MRERAHVSSRTTPRGQKRAVDQAIEAARQRQTMQATRIALGPNRVLGRYVDTALAWGVVCRSNDIARPDVIEHLFAFPLQAAGVAQQGRRHVFEDVNAIDGAEVAAVKSIKIFPARFVDDIAVNDGLLVERPRVRMQAFALGVIFGRQISLASFEAGEQGANVLSMVLDIVAGDLWEILHHLGEPLALAIRQNRVVAHVGDALLVERDQHLVDDALLTDLLYAQADCGRLRPLRIALGEDATHTLHTNLHLAFALVTQFCPSGYSST